MKFQTNKVLVTKIPYAISDVGQKILSKNASFIVVRYILADKKGCWQQN